MESHDHQCSRAYPKYASNTVAPSFPHDVHVLLVVKIGPTYALKMSLEIRSEQQQGALCYLKECLIACRVIGKLEESSLNTMGFSIELPSFTFLTEIETGIFLNSGHAVCLHHGQDSEEGD